MVARLCFVVFVGFSQCFWHVLIYPLWFVCFVGLVWVSEMHVAYTKRTFEE